MGERRLVMMSGDGQTGENVRTFVFKEENHTLGNSLKSVILQNPSVIFVGYSIPHPSEDQMLLRIQCVEGYPASEALRKGFQDLKSICQITKSKFQTKLNSFKDTIQMQQE